MCMRRQRESKTHFHREGFRCAYFETEERATLPRVSHLTALQTERGERRGGKMRDPENEFEEKAAAFCNCFCNN